jgi:HK97 family phage prohead protease
MVPDFTGYVTRYGIKCSDGRTIQPHAFKHNDKNQVPLVWQHQHNTPENVLGHLVLSHREDGVAVEGFFNDTLSGQQAKALVIHKDISALSIFANKLVQSGSNVTHGDIKEGSLVLAGANPGAFIENVNVQHGDVTSVSDEEVIIYSGDVIEHAEKEKPSTTTAPPKKVVVPPKADMPKPSASNPDPDKDGDNDLFDPKDGGLDADTATVQQVLDTLTPEQKNVVDGLIGAALQQDSDSSTSHHDSKGDDPVSRNVFDQTDADKTGKKPGSTLSHSDMQSIFTSAHKGGSLKGAVEEYALSHGIDDISTLFPYDQAVTDTPDFISRRMEWVQGVLSTTRKTPFSRIRSWTADITFQEARAKGFIKGSLKKEEFIRIARRITTPQTIYKKQKLDRDDILDITEFDVVTWLQTEMRLMLDEELARAILIGDGRDVDDADKIDSANVRPIYGDDEMYVTPVSVASGDIATTADAIVDGVVNAMRFYRGSGNPTLYTTRIWLAKMLLIKDTLGRRLYPTLVELSAALGVSNVVPCEALETEPTLIGIVVNLQDYTVGADKGGEVSMFDFFDIDYNQFKYLMETRVSGAMTKYRGALSIVEFTGVGGLLPDPAAPTFDSTSGIGTIPDPSGLHYTYVIVADDGTEGSALSAGAQAPIASNAYVTYRAVPASTYEFSADSFEWTFRRD